MLWLIMKAKSFLLDCIDSHMTYRQNIIYLNTSINFGLQCMKKIILKKQEGDFMLTEPTLREVTLKAKLREIEKRLHEFDGNRRMTAESLGISRQQLQSFIARYHIPVPPPVRYRRTPLISFENEMS